MPRTRGQTQAPRKPNAVVRKNATAPKVMQKADVASEYKAWFAKLRSIDNQFYDEIHLGNISDEAAVAADSEKFIEMGIDNVVRLVRHYFYDPHVMAMVRNRLIYERHTGGKADVQQHNRRIMSEVILGFYRFGNKSVNGIVYSAGIANDSEYIDTLNFVIDVFSQNLDIWDGADEILAAEYEDKFVQANAIFAIKTPVLKNATIQGVIHEYLVGLEMNKLRAMHCPYFVYTYDLVRCNSPVFFEKNILSGLVAKQIAPGDDVIASGYIITELIDGAKSFDYVFLNSTYEEFVPLFALMVNGMMVAWLVLGYIHGDFHAENALVRNYGKKIANPYHTGGKIVYIDTIGTPTGFDFGTASTKANPWYSSEGSPKATPVHDVIRFLLYLSESGRLRTVRDPRVASFVEEMIAFCMYGLQRPSTAKGVEQRISPETKVNRTIEDVVHYLEVHHHVLRNATSNAAPAMADFKKQYKIVHDRHFTLEELIVDAKLRKDHLQDTITLENEIVGKIATVLTKLISDFDQMRRLIETDDLDDEYDGVDYYEMAICYGALINRYYTDMVVKRKLAAELGFDVNIRGVTQRKIDEIRHVCYDYYYDMSQSYKAFRKQLTEDEQDHYEQVLNEGRIVAQSEPTPSKYSYIGEKRNRRATAGDEKKKPNRKRSTKTPGAMSF